MIIEYLEGKGWRRVEKRDEAQNNFNELKLYWAQCKCKRVNNQLKIGKQLVYQIPNNSVLTNKIGILCSLRSYDRYLRAQPRATSWHLDYKVFVPQTYRLDIREERNEFFTSYREGEVWISKPTAANRGIGIYLLSNPDDVSALKQRLEDREKARGVTRPIGRIVQRYILYPLLLNRRKFDVRAYCLILNTPSGPMTFFRPGYCRLTIREYAVSSTDLSTHLTNQALQKKDPNYEDIKDDTVWSMNQFNEYINLNYASLNKVPENWVITQFNEKCKQIAAHCIAATKGQLDNRVGFFDLIGVDYLVDESFNTYLLEMNTNPALSTNCAVLKDLIPDVVTEMMDMTLELQENLENSISIRLPFKTQRVFKCIYNATKQGGVTPWRIQHKALESRNSLSQTEQQYLAINNKRSVK